jgi:exonuclease SbcC
MVNFQGPDPVGIDYDAQGPGLVALVGRNGEGKTTLLESPAAALHKSFPSRPGSLYQLAHGRDAFLEATFQEGTHELKVRVAVDAERRTSEGYVFEDGRSLTTGRAAEFGSIVTSRFGSEAMLLASVFSAQNKAGSFLTMPKVERKALFAELLGLAGLEQLHELAKEARTEAEADLQEFRRNQTLLSEVSATIPAAEQALAGAELAAQNAERCLDQAQAAEASAIDALARARAANESIERYRADVVKASAELARAQAALDTARALPGKIAQTEKDRLRALDAKRVEAMETDAVSRHSAMVDSIGQRRLALMQTAGVRAEVEAAEQALPGYETEISEIERADRERADRTAQLELEKQAIQHMADVLGRATRNSEKARKELAQRAALIGDVPCTKEDMWFAAPAGDLEINLSGLCPLLADARESSRLLKDLVPLDEEVRGSLDFDPRELQERQEAYTLAMQDLSRDGANPERANCYHEVRQLAADARRRAAFLPSVEVAEESLLLLQAELETVHQQFDRDLGDARMAKAALDDVRREIEDWKALALKDALAELENAQTWEHQASIVFLSSQEVLNAAISETGDVAKSQLELEAAQKARVSHQENIRAMDRTAAELREKLSALMRETEKLEAIAAGAAGAADTVSDWTHLERALGKDGVQALEIDAAGPEVATLTNGLLEACYGPRFSISFETLREKKSAKGEFAEAFDVQVYDGPETRRIELLSGGEKVIVGEAIGLALAIYNARKSGIKWETLFRDETSGALDPESAQAYILMLRRARELGGFHQVIFVAHQLDVWHAADAQVFIQGGKISVGAPLEEAA